MYVCISKHIPPGLNFYLAMILIKGLGKLRQRSYGIFSNNICRAISDQRVRAVWEGKEALQEVDDSGSRVFQIVSYATTPILETDLFLDARFNFYTKELVKSRIKLITNVYNF